MNIVYLKLISWLLRKTKYLCVRFNDECILGFDEEIKDVFTVEICKDTICIYINESPANRIAD